jgi:hypothetical protein
MSFSIRSGVAVALAVAGVAVAGCGDTVIDNTKAEDAIQRNLQSSLHEKIDSVSCPSDQKVVPGETFECTVTAADGKKATATLKILNKDADVSLVDLKPEK